MIDRDAAFAYALTLPGAELSTSYGQPAVKVAATGRAFVTTGHEPASSFVLALDLDTIELLKATDPAIFWQTPHYEGWAAVLVRYDGPDPDRVREAIVRAHARAAAMKPVRPRARR